MFYARTIIAIVLCLGLQTSLCTGGALAFLNGATQQLSFTSSDGIAMSYASIGYLTCKDNTLSPKEITPKDSGCGDASDCLVQAFQFSKHQAFASIAFGHKLITPLFTGFTFDPPIRKPVFQLARAGPLYVQAKDAPHFLLKRE